MIIIDGVECADSLLNPEKHKFIGTFRYPFKIIENKMFEINDRINAQCPICKRYYFGLIRDKVPPIVIWHDCYKNGHFDLLQYSTI